MPHNLFNGRLAFVDVPWHKLGTRVPASVTAAEMIEAAGLAWKVTLPPAPGARLIDPDSSTYDRYLIIREPFGDETEGVALGLVGSGYVPLQNLEAFSFFEPFIRNGWATFHTAGALGNGERVWVLAKMSGQIMIGRDDPIDKYLLLSNTHDGTGAVSIRFTPIRVVCQNTLNWAEEGGSSVISVRHSKNIAKRLKDAQDRELKQSSTRSLPKPRHCSSIWRLETSTLTKPTVFSSCCSRERRNRRRRIKSPSDGLASGRFSTTAGSRRYQPAIRYGASITRSSERKIIGTAGKARPRVWNASGLAAATT
jgi:hypothetical protein